MSKVIRRGDMIQLSSYAPFIRIGFDWEQDFYEMDTDVMAFVLDEDGIVSNEQNVVFYNNYYSENKAVRITDDNRYNWEFVIDVAKLPVRTRRIVFVHTIYDAAVRRQNMSQIQNYIVSVDQSTALDKPGEKVATYCQEGKNPPQELLIVCELRKKGDRWFFVPLSNGFDGNLTSLCGHYGLKI